MVEHPALQERRTEPTPSQKRLDRIIDLLEEIVAHQARAEARAVVLLADQQHYGDEQSPLADYIPKS